MDTAATGWFFDLCMVAAHHRRLSGETKNQKKKASEQASKQAKEKKTEGATGNSVSPNFSPVIVDPSCWKSRSNWENATVIVAFLCFFFVVLLQQQWIAVPPFPSPRGGANFCMRACMCVSVLPRNAYKRAHRHTNGAQGSSAGKKTRANSLKGLKVNKNKNKTNKVHQVYRKGEGAERKGTLRTRY